MRDRQDRVEERKGGRGRLERGREGGRGRGGERLERRRGREGETDRETDRQTEKQNFVATLRKSYHPH